MTSNNQITAYIAHNFPALHAQTSDHGVNRGSIQVFDATSKLVADIDTTLCRGQHDITLANIGRIVREG